LATAQHDRIGAAAGPPADERASADGVADELGMSGIKVSGYARRRMEQASAPLHCSTARRLRHAIERAEQKGSKDSLILLDNFAFVVSVEHMVVVTAVEDGRSQEGIFTHVDSVVIG
jgi:flagellar operon protein